MSGSVRITQHGFHQRVDEADDERRHGQRGIGIHLDAADQARGRKQRAPARTREPTTDSDSASRLPPARGSLSLLRVVGDVCGRRCLRRSHICRQDAVRDPQHHARRPPDQRLGREASTGCHARGGGRRRADRSDVLLKAVVLESAVQVSQAPPGICEGAELTATPEVAGMRSTEGDDAVSGAARGSKTGRGLQGEGIAAESEGRQELQLHDQGRQRRPVVRVPPRRREGAQEAGRRRVMHEKPAVCHRLGGRRRVPLHRRRHRPHRAAGERHSLRCPAARRTRRAPAASADAVVVRCEVRLSCRDPPRVRVARSELAEARSQTRRRSCAPMRRRSRRSTPATSSSIVNASIVDSQCRSSSAAPRAAAGRRRSAAVRERGPVTGALVTAGTHIGGGFKTVGPHAEARLLGLAPTNLRNS